MTAFGQHVRHRRTELGRVERDDDGDLTVATSETFASYWLMSRVAQYRVAHPEVELRLVAAAPVSDLATAGIDLAVRYGRGTWPNVEAIHLLDNEVFPICAPDYFDDRPASTASRPGTTSNSTTTC